MADRGDIGRGGSLRLRTLNDRLRKESKGVLVWGLRGDLPPPFLQREGT
jgi:hypothetical protein